MPWTADIFLYDWFSRLLTSKNIVGLKLRTTRTPVHFYNEKVNDVNDDSHIWLMPCLL